MTPQHLGQSKWSAFLLAFLALVLAACPGVPVMADEFPATYLLQYRFTPGQAVRYVVESKTHIEVQQEATEQTVEHSEITDRHYTVISTEADGNATLELMLDRARMSVTIDTDEPVSFDSASNDTPPAQFVGVAGTIGKPLSRIQVTPSGELRSFEWLIEVYRQADAQNKEAGNRDILVPLPTEPIALQGEWKERFETDVVVGESLKKPVTLMRKYRLASVEEGIATIEFDTAVITPLRDPAQEAQLIHRAPSGTVTFDIERGVLLSRTSQVDREVVGFNGAKSRIRNVTTRSERIADTDSSGPVQTTQESTPAPR